eukprot:1157844-Pelagomonas_calceolata.AAC.7
MANPFIHASACVSPSSGKHATSSHLPNPPKQHSQSKQDDLYLEEAEACRCSLGAWALSPRARLLLLLLLSAAVPPNVARRFPELLLLCSHRVAAAAAAPVTLTVPSRTLPPPPPPPIKCWGAVCV